MELSHENKLELVVSDSATSIQDLFDSQKDLFRSQIDELENIVFTQCKLTGVNPLSQEMAAGALSVNIGKRPRDLLNPKAIKYMHSIFSIKDAISKKETREISALFGVTATQVREFFTSQRTRVRKFVRLSREKATRSSSGKDVHDEIPLLYDPNEPLNPVPLDSIAPTTTEQGATCSKQDEILPPVDESDKHFLENIFSLMRKEETFSGQVKLMEWILQIQNSAVLYWFISKGGIMILATWLSLAVVEEQTSVLHVILKVLCHLPLQKALPVHMSAVLQSVNRLRFYKASDISNRARILLSRWSKAFARCQALKKTNGIRSASDAQDEMLLKQSINEVMSTESWDSKIDINAGNSSLLDENSGNIRKLESQPLKLLTGSADDTNKKLISGVRSSQGKERRKVLLVEQPCQKSAGRSSQVGRSAAATQGRPLSADDIQKAKMRAQFMQSKYGKTNTISDENPQLQLEDANRSMSSQASILQSTPKAHIRHVIEETKKSEFPHPTKVSNLMEASVDNKMAFNLDETPHKRCKRTQIPWQTPPEISITVPWRVGTGENSKEIEVQKNRILRERETVYKTVQEIPTDPKEPWDREIDYDDTLTPEIPTVQLPDVEGAEAPVSPQEDVVTTGTSISTSSSSSQNAGGSMPEPDLELLAVLLKNPELVFALTSGQAGNMSIEETVKLFDMIKTNGLTSSGSLTVLDGKAKSEEKIEVSLPSPTPSSDPVTGGWKPDFAKNPFSRQKLNETHEGPGIAATLGSREKIQATSLVQHEILPGAVEQLTAALQLAQQTLTTDVHSQEKLPATNLLQPQILPSGIIASQQPATVPQTVQQLSWLQAALGLHEQPLPPVTSSLHLNVPAYASNIQSTTTSELMPNTINASVSNIASRSNLLNAAAMQIETSRIVHTSALHIVGAVPSRPVGVPLTPALATATSLRPHTQMQPSYASERPLAHSWRPRQGMDPTPHYRSNLSQNKYNPSVGSRMQEHGSWESNDLVDETGFESWSPESSPIRAGYNTARWNLPDSRMNFGHRYGPERSISRNPGYRDLGKSGNKRCSDRRR